MTAEKYKSKRSDSILTPEIRWAYPFVHEKSTKRPNGQPRKMAVWIIAGLMPKLHHDATQCPNYRFLSDLCMQAVSREPTWGGAFPAGGHWPIQDGDAPPKPKPQMPGQPVAPVDPTKGAWRKGHWCFEASTSLDPGPRVCVLQNGQTVEIPAKIINGRQMYKGGDFGFGSIHAYTFFNEKWGVNFGFEGILWTREGEAIGNSGPRSAAAMFGNVASAVPPNPVTMPGYAPPSMPGRPVSGMPAGQPAPGAAPVMPAAPQYAPPPVPTAPALAPTAPQAAPMPTAAPLPPLPAPR